MPIKKERIQTKVKMILASFGPLKWDEIDLKHKIEDNYIAKEEKEFFVDEILFAYPNVRSTKLYNQMFNELKTGNDVVEFIEQYY